jgi:Flp pilus assembly protein TadB
MKTKRAPRLRLEFAFAYLLPLPSLVVGLLWAVLFLAISFAISWYSDTALVHEVVAIDGTTSLRPTNTSILMFVASLMWGFLPTIMRLSTASEEWDLSGRSAPAESRQRWREEKVLIARTQPSSRALLPASLAGLAVALLLITQYLGIDFENWSEPALAWIGLQMVVLFQLLFRGFAFTFHSKKRRKPFFEAAKTVDLLDLTPQHRAARCALRSCLAWLAGASLSSLFFMLGGNWLTTAILVVVTVIAATSLLPPVLQMQRRIRRAKSEERERLHEAVHDSRDAVMDSKGPPPQPGHLADLLGYLDHIENLPELPFDRSKLAIASLYFAVPLGSWLLISGLQILLNLG